MLTIYDFKVCHLRTPIGLGERPAFGWKLNSDAKNVLQEAYSVTILGLWTTGRVESRESICVPYDGPALQSSTRYTVQLTVWDNQGNKATAETIFETALHNFTGQWITHTLSKEETACPVFCKQFAAQKPLRARLHVSACGIYEASINGHVASDALFAPGWTNYHKRIQYQTYDVTDLIETDNRVAITVAPGWYAGFLNDRPHHYGERTAVFAELHLWYADGSHHVIATDESWVFTIGSVRYAEFYNGQITDFTVQPREMQSVEIFREMDHSHMVAQISEPVRIIEKRSPVSVIHTPKGETVLDFGQNLSGFVEITTETTRGQVITIRHCEILDRDGNFYTENLRSAKATDTYICKGGWQTLRPSFTYHGFRYAMVEGVENVDPAAFHACVVHSDFEETATFDCSSELVSRLWQNIRWSMRSNFVDIPTDCPQRDERLGWTGDAAVFSRTACHLGNPYNFFRKWLADLASEQSLQMGVPDAVPNILAPHGGTAVWADSAAIVPWNVYQLSGDPTILRQQYDSMKCWVEHLRQNENEDHLRMNGHQRGDWLALDREEGKGNRGVTDPYLIASAFYAHSTWILKESAKILGYDEDYMEYSRLFEQIKEGFQKEFITANGRVVFETQTACALILCFDLCKAEHRSKIIKTLTDNLAAHKNTLTTGFIGTPYLCQALTENRHHDLAGKLLMNEKFPGWLNQVKLGATTIWERWDSMHSDGSFDESGMNSFNHYSFGAIGAWMVEHLAGVQAVAPGYREIALKPQFIQGLTRVDVTRRTPYGDLRCAWKCVKGTICVDVTIPVNTNAIVYLPEKEQPVSLGSGNYHYEYETTTRLEPLKYTLDTLMGTLAENPAAVRMLEEAMPGSSAVLSMEYVRTKSVREILSMAPAGSECLYQRILNRLNELEE